MAQALADRASTMAATRHARPNRDTLNPTPHMRLMARARRGLSTGMAVLAIGRDADVARSPHEPESQRPGPHETGSHEPGPPKAALAALLLVAALALGGWFLMRELRADARIQDCVASGRTNCAPITP